VSVEVSRGASDSGERTNAPPPQSNLPIVIMLLSSVAASVSLGMVSYTFATGSLPFGVAPLLRAEPAVIETAAKADAEPVQRPGEHYALRLYQAIEQKQAQLEADEAELAEERRQVEELLRAADLRESELQRMEARIDALLDHVSQTEVANVKQIGNMLGAADGKAAAEILLAMDQDLAARVLYFMNEKTSGQLITAIQKGGDASQEKAVEILEKLRQMTEEPTG
jgi:flagellar motility protein MotE (MotC chaperone)